MGWSLVHLLDVFASSHRASSPPPGADHRLIRLVSAQRTLRDRIRREHRRENRRIRGIVGVTAALALAEARARSIPEQEPSRTEPNRVQTLAHTRTLTSSGPEGAEEAQQHRQHSRHRGQTHV